MSKIQPDSVELTRSALADLRRAYGKLKQSGAKKTASKVAACINSAEGAVRYAEGRAASDTVEKLRAERRAVPEPQQGEPA